MNEKFKYFLFVSLLITANAVCADSDYYLERARERWKQQDEEKEKRRLENEAIHEKQKQAEKNYKDLIDESLILLQSFDESVNKNEWLEKAQNLLGLLNDNRKSVFEPRKFTIIREDLDRLVYRTYDAIQRGHGTGKIFTANPDGYYLNFTDDGLVLGARGAAPDPKWKSGQFVDLPAVAGRYYSQLNRDQHSWDYAVIYWNGYRIHETIRRDPTAGKTKVVWVVEDRAAHVAGYLQKGARYTMNEQGRIDKILDFNDGEGETK